MQSKCVILFPVDMNVLGDTTEGIFVFRYARDDSLTRFEKIIVTLYEAGAMAQSDMAKVFDWSDYTLSRAIAAANGESKKDLKIGSIVEQPGVKNSGKIRYLTRSGLEVAASMLGVEPPPKNRMLNEAELRIAAQIAKFATAYAASEWREWIYSPFKGPYALMNEVKLTIDDVSMPWPSAAIFTDPLYFITYITPLMTGDIIQQRIKQWDVVKKNISKIAINEYLNSDFYVLFLAQTDKLVAGVPKQAKYFSPEYADHYFFSSIELLYERVASRTLGQRDPS